jgi:hypothetical protein
MSQSADTAYANADADEDVDVVLDSLCSGCVDFKKIGGVV